MAEPRTAEPALAPNVASTAAPVSIQQAQPVPPASQPIESSPAPAEAIPAEATLNSDDYEPAINPNAGMHPGSQPNVITGAGPLPTYDDLASSPGSGLPQLRLDMHVYSANPQGRFIFLNMQRLHEGGSLADGVRVEQITPDGAILSYRSSKFLLATRVRPYSAMYQRFSTCSSTKRS